jgi:hypothetical protein
MVEVTKRSGSYRLFRYWAPAFAGEGIDREGRRKAMETLKSPYFFGLS